MKKHLLKFFSFLLTLITLIVLPFIVLIRGSVFFHQEYQISPYLSLALGGLITFILLFIYFTLLYGRLFGLAKLTKKSLKGKAVLVSLIMAFFLGYTLFYLADGNAKTTKVQQEFTSLHPILRVSVGTILLLDQSMLITSMSRAQEDYKKMGLKTLNNSLHYPQKDGYVHAMDLRTNDRSEYRNWMLETYFKLMGFNTLRHVGTADHLHISLSIHENPKAI